MNPIRSLRVVLLLGPGLGLLPAQTTFARASTLASTQCNSITFGDLGGSPLPETVLTHLVGPRVEVFPNLGNCNFPPGPAVILPATDPRDAVVTNYNGGLNDLVVVEHTLGGVMLYAGLPLMTFAPSVFVLTDPNPIQVIARDFDGGGTIDLAVLCEGDIANSIGPSITLLRGNGLGGFVKDPSYMLPATVLPYRFATGCFDSGTTGGSILPDLAVSLANNMVEVLRNVSAATLAFSSAASVAINGSEPRGITAGDFDGDGYDDIVTANAATDNVCRLVNQGWGAAGFPVTLGFTALPVVAVTGGDQPWAITNADLDCDGDQDLALVCRGTFNVSIGSMHCLWNQNGFGSGIGQQLAGPVALTPVDIEAAQIDGVAELDLGTSSLNGPDYLVIFCNQHPPGRCCHRLRAGVDDNFAAGPTPEYACPRPALSSWITGTLGATLRNFDVTAGNRHFAHSFTALPNNIVSARLRMRVQASSGNANDGFALAFVPGLSPHFLHAAFLNRWYAPTGTGTFTIDLADMPGGLNLVPYLNATKTLDVFLQDDTDVDFITLDLESCCECAAPTLTYDHTPLVNGATTQFTVSGGPPNGVGILVFGTGLGCTPLPPPMCGLCVTPGYLTVIFFADGAGNGSVSMPIPNGFPACVPLHSQMLMLDSNSQLLSSCTISDYTH